MLSVFRESDIILCVLFIDLVKEKQHSILKFNFASRIFEISILR